MPDPHAAHDTVLPEETTPQGTQQDGVIIGHEGRDINLRDVISWLAATVISVILVQLIAYGGYDAWRTLMNRRDTVPSPIFAQTQTPPPPLLEPNPVDTAMPERRGMPIRYGPDFLHDFRVQEDQQLQRLGLQSAASGRAEIPPALASSVMKDQAGPLRNPPGAQMSLDSGTAPGAGVPTPPSSSTPDALVRPMPSESSGGTMPENELR